ncbi:MAG: glycosyltransferase [Flavobacteriaceae bacterium]|nr:glycosyltransferase [Flavobacteriaceae bacterium]
MKQKILYFVPDCPVAGAAGNITRFKQMLFYFNEMQNAEVDFISLSDWGDWFPENIQKFKKIFPNINLILLERKNDKRNFLLHWLFYKIPNFIPKLLRGISVDISNPFLNKRFAKIINAKKYDKIIISYASWGNLIKNIKYKTHLILDTHDFITGQKRNKRDKIGKFFQSEMQILNNFDEIWTYSVEEEYIFGQFTDKKITLIPISFPYNETQIKDKYLYDVIFVGSNNPHNITGIQWFAKEVIPYLSGIKVHIIGKVCTEIPDHPNFVKHGLVDSLEEIYHNAKVVICPMLSGTGVKIKVLEALSYALPVITHRRGIDGLINKTENGCIVCDDGKQFAEVINKLLNDNKLYRSKKDESKKYFLQNHTPEKEQEILNTIFK